MRRIVDLTVPIEEHWRYGFKVTPVKTHANGDPWQNASYNLESHWYTHIDAPLHFDPNGESLDAYPIQDWAITDCLVLDFSDCGDNTAITAEMLEKANERFRDRHFDSLLIRTDRARKAEWTSTEYWDNSPYLTEDAGIWLKNYHPKLVGYDFAQDYAIRKIRTMKPGDEIPQPVHEHVLKQGKILQIEYITNLWEIGSPVCQLIALPLNTQHADGSQIRVIAVVEE
ncbi:cyclase family protein [Oscillibacter sp.]|jgi:arylformamidase|uniref:cyclase family protein n=1 Tax=Oscillibacter sp. TaxID=1945593 RepID=UPI00216DC442|nr:cyclase family protein [Oscillibacter sp.]MCI8841445.1 cyclase family protein [Oscillibacter sp.]MCI9112840.1 cyclase family protein [Oscillibacter sp.]MCI9239758.1 cyclase family protein [Oscillibacter sp.]MCI9299841.1 cyclase family protein [Oscillibacter sp.]MCI9460807.1 cyclase family protein [Oscillibacter sp.]